MIESSSVTVFPCPRDRRMEAVLRTRIPLIMLETAEVTFCVRGVVSPLLANLFLHYAFDVWMKRHFPGVRFERYADDAIVHCRSERQAQTVLDAIRGRFAQCEL